MSAVRMKHRETGSEIVVPDEKAAVMHGMGYSRMDEPKKAAAKKPAAKATK